MAARAATTGPVRSTSSTARSSASGISHSGTPPATTPAAATTASSPPKRCSAWPTAATMAPGSQVSAITGTTVPCPSEASRTTAWSSSVVPRG